MAAMRALFGLGAAAFLWGCGAAGDGRYVGTMETQQGSCGPGFGPGAASATLLLRGGRAEFYPNDGVTLLEGTVSGAGQVHVANTAPGADHKPFLQIFEGMRDGAAVKGQFASPRCRASVALTRK